MENYKELLQKWQAIKNAMDKISIDNQSRYFTDFRIEVNNRIAEYKFLAERQK